MAAKKVAATITSLDHLVLTVKSIPKTVAWYTSNLGMRHEQFTSASTPTIKRHSLIFGQQKINLHERGKEFEPKAATALPGTADLCFLTQTPVHSVRSALLSAGVSLVDLSHEAVAGRADAKAPEKAGSGESGADEGIVLRTGARGMMRSVYCRDPDENLIEISNYIDTTPQQQATIPSPATSGSAMDPEVIGAVPAS